jgi:DTW domain-containing protein YfiP
MTAQETKTLKSFLAQRIEREVTQHRQTCPRCWKSLVTCFCSQLKPFTAPFSFVIVQHLDEARNPIATARMAHLSIINSRLILDNDFSQNRGVDKLLSDSSSTHVMLYPSPDAVELDDVLNGKFKPCDNQVFEDDKELKPLVFWVLDTTWSYTNKMLRLSPSLKSIPMVKFDPDISSKFIISLWRESARDVS